jgi:hypothetical protein
VPGSWEDQDQEEAGSGINESSNKLGQTMKFFRDSSYSQGFTPHSEEQPKMENNEEVKGLMEYEIDERVNGEKVPNGLVLSVEQLRAMTYKKTLKDFNDGKGPKARFTLFIGDKTYFAPPIVMNLFRSAATEPNVLRVRLKIEGTGLATRYGLEKVLDKEAF